MTDDATAPGATETAPGTTETAADAVPAAPAAALAAPAAPAEHDPAEPRRRRTWWIPVLAVGVVLLGATGTYLASGWFAHTVRNEHIVKVAEIEQRTEDALGDLKAAITRASDAGDRAARVAAVAVDGLGSDELADELDAAATTATEGAGTRISPLPDPIAYDESDVRPAWISIVELLETRDRGNALLAELETFSEDATSIDTAAALAEDARVAFYASAAESAADALEANAVATYESRIAVQHGIDQAGDGWAEEPDSVGAYAQLSKAVDALRVSGEAESARRAEPEYAERGPVEEFARSIAHGVNLDFTWAYTVNDHPSDGWYAGNASYRYTDGGWAAIQFSHSIGWDWTDDVNVKAVIVHEVGHAQVVRDECDPLFTGPVFAGDDEMWATAWAIASGYDVEGSGIQAYGRPSDAQIAEAAKCI